MSQRSNEKHHFLTSLREEKLTLSANGDTMTDTTASEYGLRARVEPDNRPIGQLSDRQRGMRAAFEVLKGAISPRSAKNKYQVDRHTVKYYKAKLIKDGMEAAATPCLLYTSDAADE